MPKYTSFFAAALAVITGCAGNVSTGNLRTATIDVRAERIYPEIARLVLGETRMPWTWEYDWLARSALTAPR